MLKVFTEQEGKCSGGGSGGGNKWGGKKPHNNGVGHIVSSSWCDNLGFYLKQDGKSLENFKLGVTKSNLGLFFFLNQDHPGFCVQNRPKMEQRLKQRNQLGQCSKWEVMMEC